MKRLAWFLVALFLTDRLVGATLARVARMAYDGPGYGVVNSALAAAANHDVILLGSSTTRHGYDPRILAEALGRPVYNAGDDGMDYDFDYGLMRLMSRRGHPAVWVVTLDDVRLLAPRHMAEILAPYMDEDPVVKALVLHTAGSRFEALKYFSQSVRYNGNVVGAARDILIHPHRPIEGYEPQEGDFTPAMQTAALAEPPTPEGLVPNPYQLELLRSMVTFARQQGEQIVFALPPYYVAPGSRRSLRELHERIARDLGVPLLDYTVDTTPLWQNPAYFIDVGHVNPRGATELSHLLAQDLKRMLPST